MQVSNQLVTELLSSHEAKCDVIQHLLEQVWCVCVCVCVCACVCVCVCMCVRVCGGDIGKGMY